jgi:hypothetical protein
VDWSLTTFGAVKPSWFTTPNGGSVDLYTVLTGTPLVTGNYAVSLVIECAGSHFQWQNFTITVTSPWAPTYTSAPILIGFNLVAYTYHITLNESSTFRYVNGPAWLTVNHNGTNGISFYLNGTAVLGSYTIKTKATSVAGGLIAYQNFTLTISLPPHPVFTSTPVTVGENGTYYTYTVTTNMACTFTLTISPAWLAYGGGKVSGNIPSAGAWLVNIQANSTLYGTTTNQTYALTATPLIADLPIDTSWMAIIPLIILLALVLFSAWSREEGFSVTIMLGSTGIGIGMMVAVEALATWFIIVPVAIIILMIYRGMRGA